jgi:hypothetical protein
MPVKRYLFLSIFLLAMANPYSQSVLTKTTTEVASIRGDSFKKMADGGKLVYHFQRNAVHAKFGNYTVSEFVYFDHDTCFKDVTILPRYLMSNYIDSFNLKFKQQGTQAWRGPDSSFISISLRDGLLDVTSFSASYYQSMAGH